MVSTTVVLRKTHFSTFSSHSLEDCDVPSILIYFSGKRERPLAECSNLSLFTALFWNHIWFCRFYCWLCTHWPLLARPRNIWEMVTKSVLVILKASILLTVLSNQLQTYFRKVQWLQDPYKPETALIIF